MAKQIVWNEAAQVRRIRLTVGLTGPQLGRASPRPERDAPSCWHARVLRSLFKRRETLTRRPGRACRFKAAANRLLLAWPDGGGGIRTHEAPLGA
jgi:hypothetical protein